MNLWAVRTELGFRGFGPLNVLGSCSPTTGYLQAREASLRFSEMAAASFSVKWCWVLLVLTQMNCFFIGLHAALQTGKIASQAGSKVGNAVVGKCVSKSIAKYFRQVCSFIVWMEYGNQLADVLVWLVQNLICLVCRQGWALMCVLISLFSIYCKEKTGLPLRLLPLPALDSGTNSYGCGILAAEQDSGKPATWAVAW